MPQSDCEGNGLWGNIVPGNAGRFLLLSIGTGSADGIGSPSDGCHWGIPEWGIEGRDLPEADPQV